MSCTQALSSSPSLCVTSRRRVHARRLAPCPPSARPGLRSCVVGLACSAEAEAAAVELSGSPACASRRAVLAAAALCCAAALQSPAHAFTRPPAGYELVKDQLDGYSFFVPSDWVQVRSAGADVFFRAPLKVDQNVFVEASSPSSTRFSSVEDLGLPQAAGAKLLSQYLVEFTSTRIGVKRDAQLLAAAYRDGADGQRYLDVEVNVQSFSVEQQYGVSPEQRGPLVKEWDRRLVTTLGVANGRLYSMRLQCAEDELAAQREQFGKMVDSFRVFQV